MAGEKRSMGGNGEEIEDLAQKKVSLEQKYRKSGSIRGEMGIWVEIKDFGAKRRNLGQKCRKNWSIRGDVRIWEQRRKNLRTKSAT